VELGGEFSTDDTPAFLNGLLTGIAEHGPFEMASPQADSQDPDEAADTAAEPETQPDCVTTDRTAPGAAADHDPQGPTEPATTEPIEAATQPPTDEDVDLVEAADDHPSDPAAE